MDKPTQKGTPETNQQSARFFKSFLQTSTDGIVITDSAQNIIEVNQTFCAFFNQRLEDVIDTKLFIWLAQLDPDAPQRWNKLEQQICVNGTGRDIEFKTCAFTSNTEANEIRHFKINISFLKEAVNGKGNVILGIWKDVTRRKQAEESLQAYKNHLEELVDTRTAKLVEANQNLQQEIAKRKKIEEEFTINEETVWTTINGVPESVILIDTEGTILAANKTAAHRLNKTNKQLVGNCIYNFLPSDVAAFRKTQVEQVLRTGKSIQFEDSRFNISIHSSVYPIFDTHKKVTRLTIVGIDTTQQKQTSKALEESKEKYRLLTETAQDLILVHTIDGQISYANKAVQKITGYNQKAVLDMKVTDLVPPKHITLLNERSKLRKAGVGGILSYEIDLLTKSGHLIPTEAKSTPLVQQKKTIGILVIARDITERKRTEEAIKQSNRELALLTRASQAFISILDQDRVLATVLEEVRRMLKVVACSIWLIDQKTDEIVCKQVTAPQDQIVRGWRLPPGTGLVGWVIKNKQSLNIADVLKEDRHYKGVDKKTGLPLRSILSIPLQTKEKVIGAIQIVDKEVGRFTNANMALVEALATTAAIAIENARLYNALSMSQQYIRNIITSSLDMIITVDMNRRIVEFNQAAQNSFGYEYHEIVGQHVDILYADHQESIDIYEETIERGNCSREILNKRKNGEVFPCLLTAAVMKDADGVPVGLMGISRDITEQKQAEEAIRESQEIFHGFMDQLPAAAFIKDENNRLHYGNAYMQENFADVLPEWTSKKADNYLSPKITKMDGKAMAENALKKEEWLADKNNITRCFQTHEFSIQRQNKPPLSGVISFEITERKRIETELQRLYETEKMLHEQAQQDAEIKEMLLNEVNHRVKNNLSAIIGLLYTERNHLEIKEQPAYQEIMNDLITRIRGLSTVHHLLSATEWTPLPLNQLTERIIQSSLQTLPRNKHIFVTVSPSSILISPKQANSLALVFNELVTNVVKYALPNRHTGQLTVNITQKFNNTISIEFRDDGPGFPKDVLQQKQHNVGMYIIRNIVYNDLYGTLTLYNHNGAVTAIQFSTDLKGK